MLLIVPIIYALDQCQNPTTPNNIPCMVVSSYKYDNCNTSQALIYNETPSLISTMNFTNYGVRCNFTWNITEKGSYFWNVTPSGDTGRLVVEADETMNLAITIGLSIFATLFIILGIYLFMHNREK